MTNCEYVGAEPSDLQIATRYCFVLGPAFLVLDCFVNLINFKWW